MPVLTAADKEKIRSAAIARGEEEIRAAGEDFDAYRKRHGYGADNATGMEHWAAVRQQARLDTGRSDL